MTVTAYAVSGMSCAHCVASVTEELEKLQTVDAVAVSLAHGTATVTGDATPEEVRVAVAEAGYDVVGIVT